MSTAANIARILKNEACKLDGVAAVLTDTGVSSYLRVVAAAIIDQADSVEDFLCDKPFDEPKAPEQPSEETTKPDTSDPVPATLPVEPMTDLSGEHTWPGSDTWDHFNSALEREMANGSTE